MMLELKIGQSRVVHAAKLRTANEVRELAAILDRFKFKSSGWSSGWGGEDKQPVETTMKDGKFRIEKDFREDQFYTPRDGEEDDDWPDFTGYKEVIKQLKAVFPNDVKVEAHDNEKSWFTVFVEGIYDAAMDNVPFEDKPVTMYSPEDHKKFIEMLKPKLATFNDKINKITNLKGEVRLEDGYSNKVSSLGIELPVLHLTSMRTDGQYRHVMYYKFGVRLGVYEALKKYSVDIWRDESGLGGRVWLLKKEGPAKKITTTIAMNLIMSFIPKAVALMKQEAAKQAAKGYKKDKKGGLVWVYPPTAGAK